MDRNDKLKSAMGALRDSYVANLKQPLKSLAASGETLSHGQWDADNSEQLYRIAHNLAGSGSTYGFHMVSNAAQGVLGALSGVQNQPGSEISSVVADELGVAIEELVSVLQKIVHSKEAGPVERAYSFIEDNHLADYLDSHNASQEKSHSKRVLVVGDQSALNQKLVLSLERNDFVSVSVTPREMMAAIPEPLPSLVVLVEPLRKDRNVKIEGLVNEISDWQHFPRIPVIHLNLRESEVFSPAIRKGVVLNEGSRPGASLPVNTCLTNEHFMTFTTPDHLTRKVQEVLGTGG